jgi:hypothetical protein
MSQASSHFLKKVFGILKSTVMMQDPNLSLCVNIMSNGFHYQCSVLYVYMCTKCVDETETYSGIFQVPVPKAEYPNP